jgi:outer membrane protein TolC
MSDGSRTPLLRVHPGPVAAPRQPVPSGREKRRSQLWGVAWAAGLLAICAAAAQGDQNPPPPSTPSLPSPPSPPSPTAAPSEAPPLTLRRAAELALASAPEIAAARAAMQGEEASARLAMDAFHPEADAGTTPGVGRGLPVAVSGHVPAVASFDLHQTLRNSLLRSEAFEARAGAAATWAGYERARVQAARAIADLYARCWSGQQLLAGAERRLRAYEAMARRAAALHEEGRATDLDLAQARLREAKARLRRMEVAAAYDVDSWELRRRLGVAAGAPLPLPEEPLAGTPEPSRALGDGSLETARAADPDLRSAARALELLERARRLRLGFLAPVTVDADAQYSRLTRANGIDQFYRKFREDDWSIALAVTVPLWTGGRLRDGLARAEAGIDRLEQQRRGRAEQIDIDLHRAEAALDQAQAAAALARQASAVAEEDLRIAGALAAEGRANPDDLDSREAALADAQEEQIKATAAQLTARVQLLAARGELLGALGIGEPATPAQRPAGRAADLPGAPPVFPGGAADLPARGGEAPKSPPVVAGKARTAGAQLVVREGGAGSPFPRP